MVLPTERTGDGFSFVNAEQVAWRPSSFAPRVQVKELGSANGRSMQLVRYEPGASFPMHHHKGPEFIYVIEGELIQHGKRLGPGWAAVAASGTLDDDVRTDSGCTFLTVYSE